MPAVPKRRSALALGAFLSLTLVLAGCTGGDPEPAPQPPTNEPTPQSDPVSLSLGVYGSEEELNAWSQVVQDFTSQRSDVEVELVEWSSHDAALRTLQDGTVPDVFMAPQRDLAFLLEEELTRPVSELLDERGVDFGDSFSRDAVAAFGVDDELQCMAYSISPMVIYLNKGIVDFDRMAARELDVPDRWDRWSLEEFAAAARFASRPARGISGFHIEPSVEALTPFIASGGGSVFDEPMTPSSLSFSGDDTQAALERTLAVLRDPTLTLSEERLERRTPLEWFTRGRLGMIAGYRDLVPELRQVDGLDFDVLSMPILDSAATVGDVTGLCLARETEHPGLAADLITHLVSDEAVEQVVRTGGVAPANLSVAASETFLQTTRPPARARVFNTAIRGIVVAPLLGSWEELEEAVAPELQTLLTEPGELDLDEVTTRIDELSRTVLDPEELEESAPEEDEIPDEEE